MLSREDENYIEVARKYNLRLPSMKLGVFSLSDEGYSPTEVRFILRYVEIPGEHRTFRNTIRGYYSLWKKAQAPKAPGK
jgi:hypothetical protein